MADSPAKRRKISPTTLVPIDALPNGSNSERPVSQSKNLQDVFAQALGETRTSSDALSRKQGSESVGTTQENDPPTEVIMSQREAQRAATPDARKGNVRGGVMSGNPRRMSKSPSKRLERAPYEHPSLAAALAGDDINPFQKKGLRRSPPAGSQPEPVLEDTIVNPFRKTGLRRSPISSQPVEREEHKATEPEEQRGGRGNGLRRPPLPTRTIEALEKPIPKPQVQPEMQRAGLRRSPVASVPVARIEADIAPPEMQPETPRAWLRRSPDASFAVAAEPEVRPEVQTRAPARDKVEKKHERPDIATTPTEPIHTNHTAIENSLNSAWEISDHQRNAVERPAQFAVAEFPSEFPTQRESQPSNTQKAQSPALSKMAELLNPFVTRRHEEPELPPTPIQRGFPDPVVTTPPSGIHDTPSKRTRRSKALGEKLKSSPLKPKDVRPELAAKELRPASRTKSQPQQNAAPQRRRRSARFIPLINPHAAKEKERDELLQQLQQLKADVALANQENERMRVLLESKKRPLHPATINSDDLLSMLVRSTAPAVSEPPKRVSLMKAVDAFLPFRPRRKPVATPILDKIIPSHLPIALEDPLPYLQAFSPLTYSSNITLMPTIRGDSNSYSSSQDDQQHIMQKHVITASHSSGLFSARFSILVDSSSLSVESIDILRLDMNAEIELGTFIRARAKATGAVGKDITVICWAMARWVEVSIQRARFWCQLDEEFGTPEARVKATRKKKKRKRQVIEDDEDDVNPGTTWTTRNLITNIGRTSMELANEDLELRFEWKIGFDYTGEVETVLSADARTPKDWQTSDDRSSLAKVPQAFDKMVKERGPMSAVRAIVGLLMPAS